MSISPLAKKLGIKPQMRMLIAAAPDLYHKSLAPLPDGARIASANDGPFTFVQLFATSANELRQEIKRIIGVEVREATAEVGTTTGTVMQVFMTGTMVQVFLLAQGVPADSWSGNGSGARSQEKDVVPC